MPVDFQVVKETEKDIRLDRWFKRHYPALTHGTLEKWLRKRNVRVDGKKATTNTHLIPGQVIRIPPIEVPSLPQKEKILSAAESACSATFLLSPKACIPFNLSYAC